MEQYIFKKYPTAFVIAGFVFLLALASPAFGQRTNVDTLKKQAQPMKLTQAIQVAMANNTQIKQALLSIKDADQQIRSAWSNVLPQVSGSMNYTRNLQVPVNFIPEVVFNPQGDPDNLVPVAFGTDNNWSGGVTVQQTLFNGQAFVGISSSELLKAAQAESLRAATQRIVTQTRTAYYSVLIAQERVNLQEAQIERIQQNLKDAKARLEQGFVDEYAVTQLQVQLSNLKPQLTNSRYAVDDAIRNLLDVMGLPVELPLKIKGSLNKYDIRSQKADTSVNTALKKVNTMTPLRLKTDSLLMKKAKNLRGDLRVLDKQQKLQDKQIKARRSQYLPTVSASYNLQYTASQPGQPVFFGTDDSRARAQTLMLNVSVPIFQGFSRDAAIQRAKIQKRKLKLAEYQAEQSAQKAITGAKQNIQQAFETASARRKALKQARRGYERALLRYNNGLGSQQEVTDAQIQLREAELNYAQMVFNYLSAKARYDQAIGMVPFVDQKPEAVREAIKSQ